MYSTVQVIMLIGCVFLFFMVFKDEGLFNFKGENPIIKIIGIILVFVFFMLMIGGYQLLFPDKDKHGNDLYYDEY